LRYVDAEVRYILYIRRLNPYLTPLLVVLILTSLSGYIGVTQLTKTEFMEYKVLYAINITVINQNRSATGIATATINIEVSPINSTHMNVIERYRIDTPPLYTGDPILGNVLLEQLRDLIGENNSVRSDIRPIYDGTVFHDVSDIDRSKCVEFEVPRIGIKVNVINVSAVTNDTLMNALYDCRTGLLVAYYFRYRLHGEVSGLKYEAVISVLRWITNTSVEGVISKNITQGGGMNITDLLSRTDTLIFITAIVVVLTSLIALYKYLKRRAY